LKPGTAKITGTAAVNSYVRIRNPFTGVEYDFYNNEDNAPAYTQTVEPGFYIVTNYPTGEANVYYNYTQFKAVKSGKKATANFAQSLSPKYEDWSADISVKVTGTLKKGQKLKASVKLYNLPYKFKAPKFKYIWTDGTKILGKKATYKLKKADLKKGKKIFVVAYGKKYGHTVSTWYTVR
jgi:hypothetical protein